jgi:hypothetical protein
MSLINDALKRARDAQQKNPPAGAPPLPPVESPARGSTGWILAVAAVLSFAAACLFLGPALFRHNAAPAAIVKAPEIPAPPPVDAVPVMPATVTNALPPPASNTNPPPATVVAEPLPKVQGIIFNAARPLAIVNGQTVNIGDRVGDFQVKQILQTSVLFQRPDGSQKKLEIGE